MYENYFGKQKPLSEEQRKANAEVYAKLTLGTGRSKPLALDNDEKPSET